VAEQLRLEEVLRNRRAVQHHERPVRRGARVVDAAGDQVLPRPGLSADEDGRGPGPRDLLHALEQVAHLLRRPEDLLAVELAAQERHLVAQGHGRQGVADHQAELRDLERLGDVVVAAELHRLDGRLHPAVGGHHDDQRLRIAAADLAQQVDAALPRLLQVLIEEHQVDRPPLHDLEAGRARPRRVDGGLLVLERLSQRDADRLLVVHDQQRVLKTFVGLFVAHLASSPREGPPGRWSPCFRRNAPSGRLRALEQSTEKGRGQAPCHGCGW